MPKEFLGQPIVLRPTQGCYQKEKVARVVKETATRFVAKVEGESTEIAFRKDNGEPVFAIDKEFPCYVAG